MLAFTLAQSAMPELPPDVIVDQAMAKLDMVFSAVGMALIVLGFIIAAMRGEFTKKKMHANDSATSKKRGGRRLALRFS